MQIDISIYVFFLSVYVSVYSINVILFAVGVCPFYDTVGNELQWRKCSKDDNCIPGKSAYLSIYVYKCELILIILT